MKGSLIMGKRQKETLSPNNYFGGKWRRRSELKGQGHFPQQVMSLLHPLPHLKRLGSSSDWQDSSCYLI